MKKIIINEDIERKLFQKLINEKTTEISKVSVVKDFLDKNFKRADTTEMNQEGMVESKPIVVWIDKHENPIKAMTDVQLFYLLQEKFKKLFADKNERDTFLKDMIKSWYHRKISKYGSILKH